MSYLRFQDEDESTVSGTVTSVLLGAVAGFAVGMLVAQRVGGFSGLTNLARRVRGGADQEAEAASGPVVADDFSDYEDDFEEDELMETEGSELEERVLEAFRNDPILAERAVDIGSLGPQTIELAGWVNSEREAQHALTIARGVPGVATVINRMAIGEEEMRYSSNARRFAEGDPAFTRRSSPSRRCSASSPGPGRRRSRGTA